jgi:hypothetical protein
MPLFFVNKPSTALSTTADAIVITASATKPLRIYFAKVGGGGTASVANEVVMQRSTGAPSGGSAITPVKANPNSAAASFTAKYDSTGTSLTANEVLHRFTVNANGGIDPFQAFPGGEISVPVSGQVSIRSVSGTSNAIVNVTVEEIDG